MEKNLDREIVTQMKKKSRQLEQGQFDEGEIKELMNILKKSSKCQICRGMFDLRPQIEEEIS